MPLLHNPRRDRRTHALERWFDKADTDPDLTDSIVEYVQRLGTITMEEAIIDAPPRFSHMALSQDKIGWRQFLEEMISTEITSIQRQYIAVNGSRMSLDKWCTGLITWLLEITHGQWLYRNYIVHDPVSGTVAMATKEEKLVEIERQRELGDAGLLEEDKYLAEMNLEEMATSLGEWQHYWLLAIQTAWNHYASGLNGSLNKWHNVIPQEKRAGNYHSQHFLRSEMSLVFYPWSAYSKPF